MPNKTLQKLTNLDQIEYPALIWDDQDDSSTLILAETPARSRILLEHAGRSIKDLFVYYSRHFANKDPQELAVLGDRFSYPLNAYEGEDFDLTKFEQQLKKVMAEYQEDAGLDQELRGQLRNYRDFDLAAALQEVIFDAIVQRILRYALELKITSLVASGNLNTNERFRSLLSHAATELGYDLRFLDQPEFA
jgi:hypothetical protein